MAILLSLTPHDLRHTRGLLGGLASCCLSDGRASCELRLADLRPAGRVQCIVEVVPVLDVRSRFYFHAAHATRPLSYSTLKHTQLSALAGDSWGACTHACTSASACITHACTHNMHVCPVSCTHSHTPHVITLPQLTCAVLSIVTRVQPRPCFHGPPQARLCCAPATQAQNRGSLGSSPSGMASLGCA